MSDFDPNAAAASDGLFGLPHAPDEAACIVIPVPFDATTSYRDGTRNGPAAVREASLQVDLWDVDLGRIYEPGIAMLEESPEVQAWAREGRAQAEPVIAAGGVVEGDAALTANLARVNTISGQVNDWVYEQAKAWLKQDRLVAVLGGDHSTPFGAIRAASEAFPDLGILHIDAHADLRKAYEGFTHSHASIMHNVMTRLPGVAQLVQVGIRDFCEEEHDFIRASDGRIITHFDTVLRRERMRGETWAKQIARIVDALPANVYVSFDIDGLDPKLCPNTGTPVAGGLELADAVELVAEVARSGRGIVALDVNEVAPGVDDAWDGNVGARLLYKMIGWAFVSRGLVKPLE